MLKKLASRKHAKDRVVAFVVTVRALEPWARGARPRRVCIGWERGASRRGTTAVREASIVYHGANPRYAVEAAFKIESSSTDLFKRIDAPRSNPMKKRRVSAPRAHG